MRFVNSQINGSNSTVVVVYMALECTVVELGLWTWDRQTDGQIVALRDVPCGRRGVGGIMLFIAEYDSRMLGCITKTQRIN